MAFKKVKANKGACGIDGRTIDETEEYLKENWLDIKEKIRNRKYKPEPVRRVEIPKPNGGVRKLGVPNVVDRVIEQAIVQIITPIVEPTFSEYSYGFRPKRRAQQAIVKALEYLNDGYTYIVDIDLEKFFDNVPQDRLIGLFGAIVKDADIVSLVTKYLKAGVMIKGEYEETEKGTPQGGNISPILSNIILDKLDKELEARELNFVRYADDCAIFVKSSAAANRVMRSITKWIERKLGLKVNVTKSKVVKPTKFKYLGFGFIKCADKWESTAHKDSISKFKRELKRLTKRSWSINMDERIQRLNWLIRGWINYFKIAKMKGHMRRIDEHLRTRLRIVIWKQWKVASKRLWGLRKLGAPKWMAKKAVAFGNHYQAVSRGMLNIINKDIFTKRGLVSCLDYYMN